jgi:hypothetical protein
MFVANRIYEFIAPGCDRSEKISVQGGQHYSPGQRRKSDVWILLVPPMHADIIPDRTEVGSYAEALQLIAMCFCMATSPERRISWCSFTARTRE